VFFHGKVKLSTKFGSVVVVRSWEEELLPVWWSCPVRTVHTTNSIVHSQITFSILATCGGKELLLDFSPEWSLIIKCIYVVHGLASFNMQKGREEKRT